MRLSLLRLCALALVSSATLPTARAQDPGTADPPSRSGTDADASASSNGTADRSSLRPLTPHEGILTSRERDRLRERDDD